MLLQSETTCTGREREAILHLSTAWGVTVTDRPVCREHTAPIEFLTRWVLHRPALSLVQGPRGGGKSYLAALATHIDSLQYDQHGTKILGGSLSQSQQIYEALKDFDRARSNRSPFTSFTRTRAEYMTGSDVSILAASSTSVRGPHVPTLRLDEVDEIDEETREAAFGMAMEIRGMRSSVSMTSTWHRVGGPMTGLMERGLAGDFPVYTFCVFEILERCPTDRSGLFVGGSACYERCPTCPIVKWCHAERDRNGGLPLAKLSHGHYTIDSLIQKVRGVSDRTFEADYLCKGPRADGLWFPEFDVGNVSESAEYDPDLPVHCAIDSGVFTGAVWFQVRRIGNRHLVNVFADYLSEGQSAELVARSVLEVSRSHCGWASIRYSTDPAGGSRNPVGPTVIGEFERVGLKNVHGSIDRWPVSSVADGLALVEGLVRSADDQVSLTVHPRCKALISGFRNYRRAKRAGQWQDYPEDPQHPSEDMVDPLRGGLKLEFPDGRKPTPKLQYANARGGRFR